MVVVMMMTMVAMVWFRYRWRRGGGRRRRRSDVRGRWSHRHVPVSFRPRSEVMAVLMDSFWVGLTGGVFALSKRERRDGHGRREQPPERGLVRLESVESWVGRGARCGLWWRQLGRHVYESGRRRG